MYFKSYAGKINFQKIQIGMMEGFLRENRQVNFLSPKLEMSTKEYHFADMCFLWKYHFIWGYIKIFQLFSDFLESFDHERGFPKNNYPPEVFLLSRRQRGCSQWYVIRGTTESRVYADSTSKSSDWTTKIRSDSSP